MDAIIPIDQLIRHLGIKLVIDQNLVQVGSIELVNQQLRITTSVVETSSAQRWSLAHQLGHIVLNHFTTEHIPHHETPTSFSRTNKSPR